MAEPKTTAIKKIKKMFLKNQAAKIATGTNQKIKLALNELFVMPKNKRPKPINIFGIL